MKTKLEMAHDWMMKHDDGSMSVEVVVFKAWAYADAMQAEADKREKEEIEKRSVELRNILNLSNSKPLELQPDVEEWQPDWSQAPDDACCWFIGGKSWDVKPYWSKYIPCYKNEETQTTWQGDGMIEAPSFGYAGDWRESLRKQPK